MERLGDYDVIGRIGTGGSADLLLAVRDGKRVVLKRLHTHLAEDEAYLRMFAAEARVMTLLDHQNIVHGGEMEESEDAVFFAMDLVDGPSFAAVQRLLREPMPIDFAVAVAMHVADALAYVHAATSTTGEHLAFVHRDIAASNILLSRDGDVKLTDFGVVKLPRKSSSFLTSASTSGGVLKGHLGTMAPEALRGAPVDGRADIYSLAVVLWEALEGRRMFEGAPLELVEKIVNSPTPPLTRELDPDLRALLAAMLAKDPALRPLNADVVAAALRSFGPASRARIAEIVRSLGVPSLRG
jgi:serine/threonine-protein kinase